MELVEIGGQRYGTSALWFLYGGILSLSLLYATRRYMLRRWYAAMVAALWILYACVNLKGQTIYVPRTIGASLPYLYVGILLPRWQKSMSMPFRRLQILLGAAIVLLYIEEVMLHPIGYARLLLLPVTVILFCSILRIRRGGGCPRTQFAENCSSKMTEKTGNMIENHTSTMDCTTESRLNSDTLRPENSVGGVLGRPGGGYFIAKIPVRTSFDIYVWHRLVFAVTSGVLGWHFIHVDCIIIYILIFLISCILRLIKK